MIIDPFKFLQVQRPEFFFRLSRVILQAVRSYTMCRAGRPSFKTAAAIRANIFQNIFDAISAKSAFKRADHCFTTFIW